MVEQERNVSPTRGMAWLAVSITLLLLLIGALVGRAVNHSHEARYGEGLEAALTADTAAVQNLFLAVTERTSSAIGRHARSNRLLDEIRAAVPDSVQVALFDADGRPTPAAFDGSDVLFDELAERSGGLRVSRLYSTKSGPRLSLLVRGDPDEPSALVEFDIATVRRTLSAVAAYDEQINVSILQPDLSDASLQPDNIALIGEAVTAPADPDRDNASALRPVAGTPFAMVARTTAGDATREHRLDIVAILLAVLLAGLITAAGMRLAGRPALRRLRLLTGATDSLRDGHYDVRVDDSAADAIGVLARSFNEMADTLSGNARRREEVESRLVHLAGHDSLTGLPNRATIRRRIEEALATHPPDSSVAVLFLDLDQFKTVNDGLGHSVGDLLLAEVAFKLRTSLDPRSVLGRFGGDEFVVVAPGLSGDHEALQLAERLRASLAAPVRLAGRMFTVGVSIGVALNNSLATAETLIQDADAAMYRAKELGRHRVVLHNEDIRLSATDRLTSMVELHQAIRDNSLRMVIQPIVKLSTNEVIAVEALVRWNHQGTEFDPGEFVSHAAELDLATELDNWVIDHVCEFAERVGRMVVPRSGWLHLNVTIASLDDPTFPDRLARIAASHDCPISALCLEVPEGYLSAAPESLLATLRELRRRGVAIALDDFGTGYSSLSRLSELPVDIVKIDQTFVHDLETQQPRQAIIEAMVALSRRLGIAVCAEGVERPSQRDMLQRLGCDVGQGYLLGMPAPAEDFAAHGLPAGTR